LGIPADSTRAETALAARSLREAATRRLGFDRRARRQFATRSFESAFARRPWRRRYARVVIRVADGCCVRPPALRSGRVASVAVGYAAIATTTNLIRRFIETPKGRDGGLNRARCAFFWPGGRGRKASVMSARSASPDRTVDWRAMRRRPQSPPGHMSDPSFPAGC
jgi:hypothetical protein